jgi:hypothetical protein
MKLLERRTPLGWPLIIAAAIFTTLLICALYSGAAFVPGRRGAASRHILRDGQPEQFLHYIRFYGIAALFGFFFGFLRLVPIENWVRQTKIRADEKIRGKGYDKDAAPWWGYLILVGVIALVIWIGKVTMYSE